MKTIIIAVANQKGGAGKTTVTRELSAGCALRGYQTLVIDCDPQGNLTNSWLDSSEIEANLSHVLVEPEPVGNKRLAPLPLSETILETPVNNLDLVASDIRLARLDQQPDYMTHRLKNQLELLENSYDLVFLDCPPQLGKLLSSPLYAADYVIIPCPADAMGLQGLGDLAYTISKVKESVNPKLEILGAVINLYKPSRNLSAEAREMVEQADYIPHIFDTNLHDYSKIAEAPSQRLPATLYAGSHKAADQLNSFTDEVLEKLKLNKHKLTVIKGEA